jgi:hypothetical protein
MISCLLVSIFLLTMDLHSPVDYPAPGAAFVCGGFSGYQQHRGCHEIIDGYVPRVVWFAVSAFPPVQGCRGRLFLEGFSVVDVVAGDLRGLARGGRGF